MADCAAVLVPATDAADTTGDTQPVDWMAFTREKKGTLEARRILDIESLVDAVDRVHYIVTLLLYSWSTPPITAGQL